MDLLKLRAVPVPPSPPQTFLSGTCEALNCLHPSFIKPFYLYEGALCVEADLLRQLPHEETWRYVFIVRNGNELRSLTDSITFKTCVLVVLVTKDEREMLIVRKLVLEELEKAGVLVVRGEDSGLQVLRDVVRDGKWPEAVYTGMGNFVLPPGWDTEGKLQAVAEACGIALEELPKPTVAPLKTEKESGQESETEKMEKAKQMALEEEEEWLGHVQTQLHPSAAKPVDDFFQKLLHR